MPLEARRATDAEAFARVARPLLLREEAAHGLMLAILDGIEQGRWRRADRWLVGRSGEPVALALRTPPHDPVLSDAGDADPAEVGRAVADAHLREGVHPRGVLGPEPVARAFADRWSDATGARAEVRTRLRLHRLDALNPVPDVPGAMRSATPEDRRLVRAWTAAFHAEATPADPIDVDETVERLLGPTVDLRVWEGPDGPVSMAAALGPTPSGVRISAVYTPPVARGNGFATALVAALTRAQLDAGRRFCMLYTDLANPTSNRVYRRIGYRPLRDDAHLRFVAPTAAPGGG